MSEHVVFITNMIGWTSIGLTCFLGLTGVALAAVYRHYGIE